MARSAAGLAGGGAPLGRSRRGELRTEGGGADAEGRPGHVAPLAPPQPTSEVPRPVSAPSSSVGVSQQLAFDQPACAELRRFRQAVGLPPVFDWIAYRESRCSNTVLSRTGCCAGWFQLHAVVFTDHRVVARAVQCGGATWANVQGTDTAAKLRHICMVAAIHDVAGVQPWRVRPPATPTSA